ncbi:MAG TPA: ATP-binding protein [Nitrospirota bacterium]|nr:ATP-binding protein [Nitrospirota bacterium]
MAYLFDTISMYSAFAAAAINAVIIILILARTSRTPFHMLFLSVCVTVCIWNTGIFLRFYTGRGVWGYFALIGTPMLPAFLFHMTNVLLKNERGNAWIPLAYIFSGFLSLCALLAVYSPPFKAFADSVYRYFYYLVLLLPFVIVSIIMMLRALSRTATGIEKSQIRYLLVAMIIGAALGVTDLIWIFGSPLPRMGLAGSAIFSTILITGIFKNRKAYDILAQMQRNLDDLGEMAAGIAHELRNPLSSIKGAVSLLAAGPEEEPPPDAREYIELIREEVARLDGILLNFQHLTKPIAVQKVTVSLNEIIRKTIRLAEIGEPSLNVKIELADDLPHVQADDSMLKQVFLNLVKNAAEACAGRGELAIRTGADRQGVTISFRDNGEGIPPHALARIFEPFFTTKRSGMGMGLALSQRIIEAHGGRIEAKNAEPTGAAFTIFLPRQ